MGLTHLEDCHLAFAPCANDGCDWKWGPWGEDVFAQRCMDHHLVDKAEAFDVAMDGACEADRPEGQKKKWYPTDCSQLTTVTAHPLKKPAAFKRCLAEMSERGLLRSGALNLLDACPPRLGRGPVVDHLIQ